MQKSCPSRTIEARSKDRRTGRRITLPVRMRGTSMGNSGRIGRMGKPRYPEGLCHVQSIQLTGLPHAGPETLRKAGDPGNFGHRGRGSKPQACAVVQRKRRAAGSLLTRFLHPPTTPFGRAGQPSLTGQAGLARTTLLRALAIRLRRVAALIQPKAKPESGNHFGNKPAIALIVILHCSRRQIENR